MRFSVGRVKTMRFQARWVCGLMAGVAAAATATSWAQEQLAGTSVTTSPLSVPGGTVEVETVAEPTPVSVDPADAAEFQVFPLDPNTVFTPVRVGASSENVTAGFPPDDWKLIYSNSLGNLAVATGAGNRIADDLTLAVGPGCRLRGFSLPVIGRVDPEGLGGPYTATIELFTNCPQAVLQTPTDLGRIRIAGSQALVSSADDGARLITVDYGDGINIPQSHTSIWMAVTFNRANVGVVMGAPASEGMTCDLFDFPGDECNSNLGGFPDRGFAGFKVDVYGDPACIDGHVGYRVNRPAEQQFNPGAFVTLADDLLLDAPGCQVIGYDVAVRGAGGFTFDLRNNCDAGAIPGTEVLLSNNLSTGNTNILRARFTTPIPINQNVVFTATVNNAEAGVILAGLAPCLGTTLNTFQTKVGNEACNIIASPNPNRIAALNVTILCAGPAPVGACCDQFFRDEENEAVCRHVPKMNCAFPRPGTGLRPAWIEGADCDPDPFGALGPCGKSACCKADDTCENLTLNECNAVLPLDGPRLWQMGQFCSVSGQRCPPAACLAARGECNQPRNCNFQFCGATCWNEGINCPPVGCEECPPVGCENLDCCQLVCEFDDFCCTTEWDDACASTATQNCVIRPPNDECAPAGRNEGATLMAIPVNGFATATSGVARATDNASDPGFGCYNNDPGHKGLHTVWYKFFAPPAIAPATKTIVNLSTCASGSPANDSLIQLFAVGNPTDEFTQCNSLIPYGCSDDFSGTPCNRVATLSRICARELTPGDLYYVMVASKDPVSNVTAEFRLDASHVGSCPSTRPDETNNFCPRAIAVNDGVTPFDLARFTPPYDLDWLETCVPAMGADMWFNYTATCTGVLTARTCGTNAGNSPDTNLVIYPGEACPIQGAPPLGCNADAGGACGFASEVAVDVFQGQPLKIRVGDNAQNFAAGNLTISCAQAICPAGEITIVETGIHGIPFEAVDARRPLDPDITPVTLASLLGTQTVVVSTTRDAQASCFSLCETSSSVSPNSIVSVVPGAIVGAAQEYTVTLARPITGGAKTTVIYNPEGTGADSFVHLLSHPGNVNGDATVDQSDIMAVRNVLDALTVPPFGLLSYDLNRSLANPLRSSGITPLDILEAIDLFNGAGEFTPWANTSNPLVNPACP